MRPASVESLRSIRYAVDTRHFLIKNKRTLEAQVDRDRQVIVTYMVPMGNEWNQSSQNERSSRDCRDPCPSNWIPVPAAVGRATLPLPDLISHRLLESELRDGSFPKGDRQPKVTCARLKDAEGNRRPLHAEPRWHSLVHVL